MENQASDQRYFDRLSYILIVIFFLLRLLPFFYHGQHPLGYDTGFYQWQINQEKAAINSGLSPFEKKYFQTDLLPVQSWGSRLMMNLLLQPGLSDWSVLYISPLICLTSVLLILYAIAKDLFGPRAALITIFLSTVSVSQYLFFCGMFWKNFIALPFWLCLIYVWQKRGRFILPLSLLIIAAIAFFHKTSAIVAMFCLVILIYVSREKRRKYYLSLFLLGTLLLVLYWPSFIFLFEQSTSLWPEENDLFKIRHGVFLDLFEYSTITAPYLVLGVIGLFFGRNREKEQALRIITLLLAIWIIGGFIFHQRITPFFDLLILVWAGKGGLELFGYLADKIENRVRLGLLAVFVISTALMFVIFLAGYKPQKEQGDRLAIESMQDEYAGQTIISLQTEDIPWLLGFSGHEVIGPGWEVNWGNNDWERILSGDIDFFRYKISTLDNPALVYDKYEIINDVCFERRANDFLVLSEQCQNKYEK